MYYRNLVASSGRIGRMGGFPTGSENKFTERVFGALNRFRQFYITWPDEAERVRISKLGRPAIIDSLVVLLFVIKHPQFSVSDQLDGEV